MYKNNQNYTKVNIDIYVCNTSRTLEQMNLGDKKRDLKNTTAEKKTATNYTYTYMTALLSGLAQALH